MDSFLNYLNNWTIGSIKTNFYTVISQSSDMNPTVSPIVRWLIHSLKSILKRIRQGSGM